MRVQMMINISGGRGDGSDWPPAGGYLECGDREALELIQGRMAIPAPLPEEPFETADALALGTELRGAPEPTGAPAGPGCPPPGAPKQAWVDHAVAAGCDPGAAASMTKADLITAYGPKGPGE